MTTVVFKIIAELDKEFQWQLESVLFESLETYLYFVPKKPGESVLGFLNRYKTALALFVETI